MPESFSFSADLNAEVLILGSMPGAESLRLGQYYAFKHNAFWPIMGRLFSFDPALPYSERVQRLKDAHVALWDVLRFCERSGSLDSGIRGGRPNDIAGFLESHAGVRRVFCNGAASFNYLKKYFPDVVIRYDALRLPSTSPAAASLDFEEKLAAYRSAFGSCLHF